MIEDTIAILYIDDDQDDLMIFGDSIGSLYPGVNVLKAQSGEEGLSILQSLERSAKPYPALIMLDMNMPRMDGRQTLQHIKNNNNWSDIPVVIFTTSSNNEDIEFCKRYNTQCITKPMSYKNLDHTVKQLISHCKIPLS
jgi:CheY-like chemotaxis protein